MKSTLVKALLISSLYCSAAWVSHAQANSDAPAVGDEQVTAGLLGKGYFNASFLTERFRSSVEAKNGYGSNLGINLPATDNVDIGLAYTFERVAATPRLTDNTVALSCTTYTTAAGMKPFAALDFGYGWHRSVEENVASRDDRALFGAGGGLEVPVSTTTAIAGKATYNDSLRKGMAHVWTYTATVDHNLTESIAARLDVLFHSKVSTTYDLGVVFLF